MSSHIPAGVLTEQKQGNATMIWAVGAFCIFGWEWILCLPLEYKRIWKRPINASSALYLANRYFGMLQLCFVMTLLASAWGPRQCKSMYLWEPVGALISTVLSQMILGSRVYAIFGKNRIVALVLSVTLVTEVIIGGIAVSTTSPPPQTGPTGPPCGAVMGPFGWLIAFWTMPLFYDSLTFFLTAWKALDFWKKEVNTPLFRIIWRDGVIYFFVIFGMNLANVLIFLTVPKGLRAVNLTPTLVLEVVLSCRLLLNLRGANEIVPIQPRWNPSGSGSGSGPTKWSSVPKNQFDPNNTGVLGDQYTFSELPAFNNPSSSFNYPPLNNPSPIKLTPNRRIEPINTNVTSTWNPV